MTICTNKVPETLGSLLFESANNWGENLALVLHERDKSEWTYQELCASVGLDKDGIRRKVIELIGTP